MIFPIFIEQTWPLWLRILLYFLALCYRCSTFLILYSYLYLFCIFVFSSSSSAVLQVQNIPNGDNSPLRKRKYFGLNFFNLKCTQVISDYFIHSFVAVFIVADIFMCSIDAITSKTKVYILLIYSCFIKMERYCLFCRKSLYQAQTAPRRRLKFPFGMELRPISF